MRIFDKGENWDSKVNFVDKNNVLVGFDMGQGCCENFGWFITKEKHSGILVDIKTPNTTGFVFDKKFFEEVKDGDFDYGGGMVIFRLTKKGRRPLFLHLYNAHNGYYAHGFEMSVKGEKIKDGSI